MRRRAFLRGMAACAAGSLLAACGPLARDSAQPKRIRRIGYLSQAAPPPAGQTEPFVQGMHELGYEEGRGTAFEFRYASLALDRLGALASELAALKVDVLVADTTPSAVAASQATCSIPIVFLGASDPIGQGLVDSLAHPGGNATGLSNGLAQTSSKNVELLAQLVPGLSQAGVLWSPVDPLLATQLQAFEAAGQALGIRVQRIEIPGPGDFEGAFQTAANGKLGAIVILGAPLFSAATLLTELAVRYRLPTVGTSASIKAAVLGYGSNTADLRRYGSSYVDRILKGAKPADLPVQEPAKFDLYVNLKPPAPSASPFRSPCWLRRRR